MSSGNEIECQYVLRVPPEIADKINAEFDSKGLGDSQILKTIRLTPFVDSDPACDELKFKCIERFF